LEIIKPGDLWGTTWTKAEVDASTFGLDFQVTLKGSASFPADPAVDFISITVHWADASPEDILERVEDFDIYLSGPPANFGASMNIVKSNAANIHFSFSAGSVGNDSDFDAFIELIRQDSSEFDAKICIQKSVQAGALGTALAGVPGSAIGFFPHCSVDGVQVTEPLSSTCFTPPSLLPEISENISLVGDTLNWSFVMPGGGAQGNVEWARARIVYTHEKTYSEGNVREQLMIPNLSASLSGIFDKTWVRDTGTNPLRPDGSETSGSFVALPSGQYMYQLQVKQSCNPHPYVSTSGFTVGASLFSLNMGASVTDGVAPQSVDFTSSRADSEPEGTRLVHWDWGNVTLLGTNISIYRNPTITLPRQGFYDPVVTYELSNGYIISEKLSAQYGEHIRQHRNIN
jgi:hypothetical protein